MRAIGHCRTRRSESSILGSQTRAATSSARDRRMRHRSSVKRTRNSAGASPSWSNLARRNDDYRRGTVRANAMSSSHRYLVPFGPKQTPHFFTDILVIGAGIAGLRAALEVPPDLRVLVVTKDSIGQSNSSFAQGGIAGVLSPEDRFENHI